MLVDTLGLIWGILITAAEVQDRDAGQTLLKQVAPKRPRLAIVWGDGAYQALTAWAAKWRKLLFATILRPTEAGGFVLLPKRWIVERTFGWLGRYRRLSKDYERNPAPSAEWIRIAMVHRMARAALKG